MSGAPFMRVELHVDAQHTLADLQAVRREIKPQMRKALREVASDALPVARAVTQPADLASALKAGSNATTAYVTAGGRRFGRWLGLAQFGGTRRDVIQPTSDRNAWDYAGGHAPAIRTPHGYFARVAGPRHYEGSRSIPEAFRAHQPKFEADIEAAVMALMSRAGTVTR